MRRVVWGGDLDTVIGKMSVAMSVSRVDKEEGDGDLGAPIHC